MAAENLTGKWVPRDTFGTRLVEVRRALNLSQEEAASRCHLHAKAWATWERPVKPAIPRNLREVVEAISDHLDVDADWLMWGGVRVPRSKCSSSTDLRLIPGAGKSREMFGQSSLPFLTLMEA